MKTQAQILAILALISSCSAQSVGGYEPNVMCKEGYQTDVLENLLPTYKNQEDVITRAITYASNAINSQIGSPDSGSYYLQSSVYTQLKGYYDDERISITLPSKYETEEDKADNQQTLKDNVRVDSVRELREQCDQSWERYNLDRKVWGCVYYLFEVENNRGSCQAYKDPETIQNLNETLRADIESAGQTVETEIIALMKKYYEESEDVANAIISMNQAITDKNSEITNMNTEIATVTTNDPNNQQRIDSLNSQLATLQDDLTNLQNELALLTFDELRDYTESMSEDYWTTINKSFAYDEEWYSYIVSLGADILHNDMYQYGAALKAQMMIAATMFTVAAASVASFA